VARGSAPIVEADSIEMKSDEYENLVKQLFGSLVEAVEGLPADSIQCGRPSRETGASGYRHQIDVSVRTATELHLIECKYWKRRVTPEALLSFAARLHDIREANPGCAVKGAVATTKSHSEGVGMLAQYFDVTLQRIASAHEFAFIYKSKIPSDPGRASEADRRRQG